MSRSPAHLREAAAALRALATALAADFAGLAAHTGPATWEGPAAAAHRRRAARVADDAQAVAAEVVDLADRLDSRASELAAAEAAAARRLAERSTTGDGGASSGSGSDG